MDRHTTKVSWRTLPAIVAGLLVGAILISPAVAHFQQNLFHLITHVDRAMPTKVATNGAPDSTSSTSFSNVEGMSTSVRVTRQSLVTARFTAESYCDSPDTSGWCSVRILIGGVEGNPAEGTNFAFDTIVTPVDTLDYWEGNYVERSRIVPAGTHTVVVQFATVDGNANTSFDLDDMHLTVEAQPA